MEDLANRLLKRRGGHRTSEFVHPEMQSRGLDIYMVVLFQRHDLRYPFNAVDKVIFFSPDSKGSHALSPDECKVPKWGGEDGFFSPNAHILDIGAGAGVAVVEINTNPKFNELGIKATGVDIRYDWDKDVMNYAKGKEAARVTGNWEVLPFRNETFDRFLSFNSNMYYFDENSVDRNDGTVYENTVGLDGVVAETTRVARAGAIWRGTCQPGFDVAEIGKVMTKYGWSVYFEMIKQSGFTTFAAKLTNKQEESSVFP